MIKNNKIPFDKDYFENGINLGISLYTNYRWIPELTIPMAFRIIEYLEITPNDKILDFGCAKGYLVQAMRLLYRNCYGVDISKYAIDNSENHVKPYLHLIRSNNDLLKLPFGKCFSHVIAKDVFEHIEPTCIKQIIRNIRKITKYLFVVVPLGDGKKYYEIAYELDKTHVIREDIKWWSNIFQECDFTINNVEYKIHGIKNNWKCKNGNGIFILK